MTILTSGVYVIAVIVVWVSDDTHRQLRFSLLAIVALITLYFIEERGGG